MELKTCISCKESLAIDCFRNKANKKRNTCRSCENTQNRARVYNVRYKVWEYLKKHPCVDCGVSDPIILEFDHVAKKKHKTIAEMVKKAYSWKAISREISKCEVRCANCHRLKTAREQKYWIYKKELGEDVCCD